MVQCGKTKHFESLDKISWNQFFKKIRAITIQCNLVRNALISRKCEKNIAIESNFCNIHTMQCNAMQTWSKIANIHCGNYWILLPHTVRSAKQKFPKNKDFEMYEFRSKTGLWLIFDSWVPQILNFRIFESIWVCFWRSDFLPFLLGDESPNSSSTKMCKWSLYEVEISELQVGSY